MDETIEQRDETSPPAPLQHWLPTLSHQGVMLMPLTAVVKARSG